MQIEGASVKDLRPRGRRFSPKVRTGCFTCRIRRIKCDEAKPRCHRCASTGRKCDGYPIDSSSPGDKGAKSSSQGSPGRALALDTTSSALERRMFTFFCNHTAPSISGYFQDETWDCTVLQLSHFEPAVRYALNALAAIHEQKLMQRIQLQGLPTPSCVTANFPVQQYSKALNRLQTLLGSADLPIDLILTCALLCIHFEALQESFHLALMHVENVTKLLRNSQALLLQRSNQSLLAAIVRLDIQASMYLGSRAPSLSWLASSLNIIFPEAFEDLMQARKVVNLWTCRMFQFLRTTADVYKFWYPGDIPIEVIWACQQLEKTLLDLEGMLDHFGQKQPSEIVCRERNALGVLKAQVKVNRLLVAGCLYAEESIYDAFEEEFDHILSICTFAIDTEKADPRLSSVLLDEGLLYPLQFVAIHCRDGRLRHKALELLKTRCANDHSGHIDAMTCMVQMCIEMEESSCEQVPKSCDIPEWRRIHSCGFDGLERSSTCKVKINFSQRLNGMDGEWDNREEIINWQAHIL